MKQTAVLLAITFAASISYGATDAAPSQELTDVQVSQEFSTEDFVQTTEEAEKILAEDEAFEKEILEEISL